MIFLSLVETGGHPSEQFSVRVPSTLYLGAYLRAAPLGCYTSVLLIFPGADRRRGTLSYYLTIFVLPFSFLENVESSLSLQVLIPQWV